MTHIADRKIKIAARQAPIRVITYGIYIVQRIRTGIFLQMIAFTLTHRNVKIL